MSNSTNNNTLNYTSNKITTTSGGATVGSPFSTQSYIDTSTIQRINEYSSEGLGRCFVYRIEKVNGFNSVYRATNKEGVTTAFMDKPSAHGSIAITYRDGKINTITKFDDSCSSIIRVTISTSGTFNLQSEKINEYSCALNASGVAVLQIAQISRDFPKVISIDNGERILDDIVKTGVSPFEFYETQYADLIKELCNSELSQSCQIIEMPEKINNFF